MCGPLNVGLINTWSFKRIASVIYNGYSGRGSMSISRSEHGDLQWRRPMYTIQTDSFGEGSHQINHSLQNE